MEGNGGETMRSIAPWGIAVLLGVLVGFLVITSGSRGHLDVSHLNYLLTVVAAAGALGGIAFALYGWITARELPGMIEKEVNRHVQQVKKSLADQLYRQQEAMQKLLAAYQVNDTNQKIALLEQAIAVDPTVYNVYIALGYAYWEKGDVLKAAECFLKDLELHPDNYQAACDLAALYAGQQEWTSALSWMKEAIRRNPSVWRYFEEDRRLEGLRQHQRNAYDTILAEAKKQEETQKPF